MSEQVEQRIMEIVDALIEDIAIWRKVIPCVDASDNRGGTYAYYRMTEPDEGAGPDEFPIYPRAEVKIPVIYKTFRLYRNGKLNISEIQKNTREILEVEGKLILVGEHKGWGALGICGLATDPERRTYKSRGRWPEYAIPDIISAQAQHGDNPPRILITTPEIYHELGRRMYSIEKLKKGQESQEQTYRECLLEQGILIDIYETEHLYTKQGTQDNALLIDPYGDVDPHGNNQWIVQTMKIKPTIWKGKQNGESWCALRQTTTIAIAHPNTITEIQDITTQLTKKEEIKISIEGTQQRRRAEQLIKQLNLTEDQYKIFENILQKTPQLTVEELHSLKGKVN